MQMELKEIIEKIKQDGVGEAEKLAVDIIKKAEEKAGAILKKAGEEQADIETRTSAELESFKKNADQAIQQAARDVLLGLKEAILCLFERIIKVEVDKQLSAQVLKEMIIKLAERFPVTGEAGIEVILNEKEKNDLEKIFLAGLKKRIAEGVTLKASKTMEKGFRIGEKDKKAYYDFTDETIAEAFKLFLNPKINKILGS
ncbi:MAG: hypothetical protein ABH869_00860 [Candidatus Omnitrophota bacterium]